MQETTAHDLGRLLAELDNIQRAASPGVNVSIAEKYYSAASTTPAGVFGLLLRDTRQHLRKLKRDKPGLGITLERRLEKVVSNVEDFPRTLALTEQGRFALGFYRQRSERWAKDETSEVV